MTISFLLTSILLGIGLSMDAACVSMTNGLREPNLKIKKVLLISIFFGLFQGLMPLIGYFCGHALIKYISKFIPWISLFILGFLGGKIIFDLIKNKNQEDEIDTKSLELTIKTLFIQAIATSIDALSVGLTFSDYSIKMAIIASLIISITTFLICIPSCYIGKKFSTILENKAQLLGAIILICIGIWIFLNGILE